MEKGICDIYYCESKPHTYELQLAEKAAGSHNYGVTSIYKTVDQPRPSGDIQNEEGNVDDTIIPSGEVEAPYIVDETGGNVVNIEWDEGVHLTVPEEPNFGPKGSFLGQDAPVVGQENPVVVPQYPAAGFCTAAGDPRSLRALARKPRPVAEPSRICTRKPSRSA